MRYPSLPHGGQDALPGLGDLAGPSVHPSVVYVDTVTRARQVAALVAIILDIADRRGRVTADDVHADPRCPSGVPSSAWGLAFTAAARTGEIRQSGGYVRSTRPSRRHGAIAVWVSTRRRSVAA